MFIEVMLMLILSLLITIAVFLYIIGRAVMSALSFKKTYEKHTKLAIKSVDPIERKAMPFIIKLAAVKIGTVLAIQIIKKKIR